MISGSRVRRWWTEEEDGILRREAILQLRQGSPNNWSRIAANLPGRTNKDCRKRWSKLSDQVKKGAWDEAEDKRLQSAVQQHGYCWTNVARAVGTRHADHPKVDHSEWKRDDDELLIAAVGIYGRNWKIIGEKRFPNRSATNLKNRYGIVMRKRQHALGVSESSSNANTISTVDRAELDLHGESDSDEALSDELDRPDFPVASEARRSGESSADSPLSHHFDFALYSEADHGTTLRPPHNIDEQGYTGPLEYHSAHMVSTNLAEDDSSLAMNSLWPMEDLFPKTVEQSQPHTLCATGTELDVSKGKPTFQTTLVLQDVQSETLRVIMDILSSTRTKVTLKTHR